ncbi:MAG: class I SAM-dependent methyltransferase [Rhodospirillaceae bacterium]
MTAFGQTVAADLVPPPDLAAIKAKQQGIWASGDYAVVGSRLQIVGENLCEAVDLRAGQKVLDVAAGNGNASLAAARRYADVVSTDYVPALLDAGRARAAADGLAANFRQADAEDLPFPAGSFDVVLSTFGVMFSPNQEKAAAEMARVCRPGGRIGLANWTPDSFIGDLFRIVGKHLPPPAGLKPPSLWGTEARLHELFGEDAAAITAVRRTYTFRYHSADHWIDVFRTYYGPTHKAFGMLDPQGQRDLRADLHDLLTRRDVGGGEGLVVPGEYLEVVIDRR